MATSIRNLFVLFLFVFLLSACSSSGTFTVKQALVEPIKSDKSISILVKFDKVKDPDEDTKNVAAALRERLYARLVSEGIFKSSVFYPNPADYILEVDIYGVRVVSNAARLAFGVMTGPSVVETEVLLKDTVTNKILTEYKVEGSSAAHPLSSESGYENAVRETANNIVNALKK